MKKIFLSLFVFTIILTGCGSDTSDEIVVWLQVAEGTPEADAYANGVARYNEENPDLIQATIEFIPRDSSGGGYEDKINAAISSGDLPDVIALDGPNLSAYVESSVLQPLSDSVTEEMQNEFISSSIQAGTINDELYALQPKDDTVVLFYNEEYVDSNSLSFDVNSPSNWSDVLDICDELASNHADNEDWVCIDYAIDTNEWSPYSLLPLFEMNDAQVFSDDGLVAEGYYNSEASAESLDLVKKMVDEGYISTASTGEVQRFAMGNSAFRLDGQWEMTYLEDEFEDINWSVTPYPVLDSWDGSEYVMNASWMFAPTSNTEHIDEASLLSYYISNAEVGEELYTAIKSIPTTVEAQEQILKEVSPEYALAVEQLEANSKPRPVSPAYTIFSSQFGKAVEQVTKNGMTGQEALDETIDPINSELSRFE